MYESPKIGAVAKSAGVTAKAIWFYERDGVLPPPARGGNSHRRYGKDAVEILAFGKRAAVCPHIEGQTHPGGPRRDNGR